jgi:hypothetical protein
MKTLFERLSDENRKKLLKNKNRWPSITDAAIHALKCNSFYTDLTISEADYILGLTSGDDLSGITRLFEETTSDE